MLQAHVSNLKSSSFCNISNVLSVRNNLWTWQSLQPTTGAGSAFYEFCDALEVKNGETAGASGWGLQYALTAWGTYWNQTYYNQCKQVSIG